MSALEYVRGIRPGHKVIWEHLEQATFVEFGLAIEPAGLKQFRRTPGARLLVMLERLFGFVLALAPIAGFVVLTEQLYQSARTDYAAMIPVSGILFLVVAGTLLVGGVVWVVHEFPPNVLLGFYALMAVFFGGIASLFISTRGRELDVDNWRLWIVPVVVSIVLGILVLIALGVAAARRTKPEKGGELSKHVAAQLRFRQEQIATLSADRQREYREVLDAAVAELERLSKIDAAEAERARGMELGALGIRM